MLKFIPDADLDPCETADDFVGQTLASFRAATADLLACGWTEQDIAAEIENALPWAVEIDETALSIAPPF